MSDQKYDITIDEEYVKSRAPGGEAVDIGVRTRQFKRIDAPKFEREDIKIVLASGVPVTIKSEVWDEIHIRRAKTRNGS
jgi:hypothetical protein